MKLYKEPKTFDEQIDILKNDYGLTINDPVSAKSILININYYCIKGYGITFDVFNLDAGKFNDGVTIEQIYQFYIRDIEFKTIIFNAIHIIEKNIRSNFSCLVAKKYNAKSIVADQLYKNFENPDLVLKIFNDVIQNNYSKYVHGKFDKVMEHHILKYENDYPLWVIVEYLDFGKLIYCLRNIEDKQIKIELKNYYQFSSFDNFVKSISTIKEMRNRISHFHRLIGTEIPEKCAITKEINSYIDNLNNRHIFAFLLLIDKTLRSCDIEKSNDFRKSILNFLNNNLTFLKPLNVPTNWEEYFKIE